MARHRYLFIETRKVRMAVFAPCLASLLLLARGGPPAEAQKQKIVLDDLETLKEADYLQLSPAGDLISYTVDGEIWLIPTQYDSPPRKVAKGRVPVWSPNGGHLAYYSNESGALQLCVFNLAAGDTEQVTNVQGGINPDPWTRMLGWGSPALGYGWSPDGAKLVFASQVAVDHENSDDHERPPPSVAENHQSPAPLVLTDNSPPSWTLSGVFYHGLNAARWIDGRATWDSARRDAAHSPRLVNQLFVVNVHNKMIYQLTKDDAVYFNPDWSPDGERILCASSEGRSLVGFGSGTTNIYVIEIATSRKIALTTGPGDKRLPRWSSDGRQIAYLAGEHLGHQSLFVMPSTGGIPINLSVGLERSVQNFAWTSNSKGLVVSFQDGVSSSIARIEVQGKSLKKLVDEEEAARWPTTVSLSGTLAWQQSGPSSTGVFWVLSAGARSSKVLLDLNPQIKKWELGEQEVVRWKNIRGDGLEGILIKPVGYQEGHRYPLIVDGYPQQQNGFMGSAMYGNQIWAARGYVIFYPNARGPHVWMNAFKSETFDLAARGPRGWDVTADDVLSGVDELIRRGIVDPDHMGLYGFSNGAAVVNAIVTRTDRFKCAVSVSPANSVDWSMPFFLSTANPLVPSVVGATPWQDPQGYTQLSLVYRLNSVTTPMLLADGDDAVLNLLASIELYNGLRYLGKDVTLLRYPDQGHGFTGAALRDFTQRSDKFIDIHLRPEQSLK